jgi:hypothetical protein
MTFRFPLPAHAHLLWLLGALTVCPTLGATSASAADLRGFASAGPMGLILFQPCAGKAVSPRTLRIEDESPDAALTEGIFDVRKIMLDSSRPPMGVSWRRVGLVVKAPVHARVGNRHLVCRGGRQHPRGATLWAAGVIRPGAWWPARRTRGSSVGRAAGALSATPFASRARSLPCRRRLVSTGWRLDPRRDYEECAATAPKPPTARASAFATAAPTGAPRAFDSGVGRPACRHRPTDATSPACDC